MTYPNIWKNTWEYRKCYIRSCHGPFSKWVVNINAFSRGNKCSFPVCTRSHWLTGTPGFLSTERWVTWTAACRQACAGLCNLPVLGTLQWANELPSNPLIWNNILILIFLGSVNVNLFYPYNSQTAFLNPCRHMWVSWSKLRLTQSNVVWTPGVPWKSH